MHRRLRSSLGILTVAGLGVAAWAQATAPKPEFDAVSIKPSAPATAYVVGCKGGPDGGDPVSWRCTNMSLSNLLGEAFGLAYYQISGPDWMQSDMFEISARVPAGTSRDDFRTMLQNMLIERFGLVEHIETRNITEFKLVVAKGGPKLTPSGGVPGGDTKPVSPGVTDADGYPLVGPGRPGMAINAGGHAAWFQYNVSLDRLANLLSGQLAAPVTNATGLAGKYDIGLRWITEGRGPNASPDAAPTGPTLMEALQDQLGLRLEATKGPGEFLIVDHMEKQPTGN